MDHEVPVAAIARLRSAWDNHVRPSSRRLALSLGLALLFGVAHVARIGSPLARAVGAAGLALLVVALVVRSIIERRRRHDAVHTLRLTVLKTDPVLGGATLRALGLVNRAASDDTVGSPALAQLHLSRLLARVPEARVEDRASRAARMLSGVGLVVSLAAFVSVVVEPFRIVEGLDVLVARGGQAPLYLKWVDDVDVEVSPPEYLHEKRRSVLPFSETAEARGTEIIVRGRPLHSGRTLVLTDGEQEAPFVEEGDSGVVARWTLGETVRLFIAARFGAVRVRQSDEQLVTSIPDERPQVKIEGAPRTVRLLEQPNISIHYEATDDHGLREVNLVLRAGMREERRLLSRPTGDAKIDRGGHELRADDRFFKKTFGSVEVTVEARDNDPITGPKWGKSAPVVILLPEVGEAEALRYAALLKARDALTDLFADRLTQKPPVPGKGAEHLQHEAQRHAAAQAVIEQALGGTYGGLQFRGRAVKIARGQLRRLSNALGAERKAPNTEQHRKLTDETGEVLLAFDAALRALGARDSRIVARRLADVADSAAEASSDAATESDQASALARLDGATTVLGGGGRQLLRLGELGLDLGEIVASDLRRIARARGASDFLHAELAARDLAARLRRPEPSFAGGGGGTGGVESGAPSQGAGAGSGDASEAGREAAAREQELEELARDHAIEIDEVENALERAIAPDEVEALRNQAKEHADAIREAIKNLPPNVRERDPGSAEAAASQGRSRAESMADALEQGRPRDAIQAGKESLRSLAEAARRGEKADSFAEQRAAQEAERARESIEKELQWAEQALEKLRRAASERARGDLESSGRDEGGLAERAKGLSKRGEEGDASMPDEMLEHLNQAEQAMRDAARALAEGNGEEGLVHQKNAQRLLEMARGDHNDNEDGEGDEESAGGKDMARKAEIPGKDQHKGPHEFRRRVMEGLSSSDDPVLKDAVKRYAEGLLR